MEERERAGWKESGSEKERALESKKENWFGRVILCEWVEEGREKLE